MIAGLILKSPDGSLTGSGWFVIAVGAWMAIGGVMHIFNYLPKSWRMPPQIPRWAQVSFGLAGVGIGLWSVSSTLLAGPGLVGGATTSRPSHAPAAFLYSVATIGLMCWIGGVVSMFASFSPYLRWRALIKTRDGLPGVWTFTFDPTAQVEIFVRLFSRKPDPDPLVEAARQAARRWLLRFLKFGGAFCAVLLIGALAASVWP